MMTNEADKTNLDPSKRGGASAVGDQQRDARPKVAEKKRFPIRNIVMLVLALVVVVALVASGIIPRLRDRKTLAAETNDLAAPTVVVALAKKGAPAEEILLPGSIQAFVDAPIYARTNGYLKHWYFDI